MIAVERIIDQESLNISLNDQRKYRHITLSNKIDCLLISDSETDKSAACCDVHVGSLCDVKVAQGLAHFLEHMLFMGTKTYPDENAYLAEHGGSSNAYTDQHNTVYYFDVQPDHFERALDIFASFFVCPLFNESSTFREVNAVDSENSKNLQSDVWRCFQLLKSFAKEDHPFSLFSTGNLATLKQSTEENGLNLRDLLLEFYDKYYSSNLMKVCVYGKESLDTLQEMVVTKFSAVPNKNLTIPKFDSEPYRSGPNQELGKMINVIPIRDSKSIELYFPMPSLYTWYESKPGKYLSHLIGHESEGSILAFLKLKGWANSLSVGSSQSCRDFSSLSVDIDLSSDGAANIDDIIASVFNYIGMLKRVGIQEWIAKEIKDMSDLNYRFLEKSQPTKFVTRMANSMQIYKAEHTVSSSYIIQKTDISMIQDLLGYLTPEKLLVLYKNKSHVTDKKEKWYGTDYSDARFSEEQLALWNLSLNNSNQSDVFLPKPNPFIPEDFELRCNHDDSNSKLAASLNALDISSNDAKVDKNEGHSFEGALLLNQVTVGLSLDKSVYQPLSPINSVVEETPEVVSANGEVVNDKEDVDEEDEEEVKDAEGSDTSIMQLFSGKLIQTWFKMDSQWKVPILTTVVVLESNLASSTPLGVSLTDIFIQVLKEVLNEFSYYADCAGLHYDILLAKGGCEMLFYGYHDKLPVLVEKTLNEMKSLVSIMSPSGSLNDLDSSSNSNFRRIESIFIRIKEKVLRSYYNSKFWQSYYHAVMGTVICLEDPRWTATDKHRALSASTFFDFLCFSRQLLISSKVEVLIHGNYTHLEAKKLSDIIVNSLGHTPLATSQDPVRRVVQLEHGSNYIYRQHSKHFNPNEVNSAMDSFYYIHNMSGYGDCSTNNMHSDSIKKEALLSFLVQMMTDKAFDQLRTKEQLGYIVFTGIKKVGQHFGLHLVVQSNHKGPDFLDERVEVFLASFHRELSGSTVDGVELKDQQVLNDDQKVEASSFISDDMLLSYRQATIEKLLEKPKNLSEESQQLMDEIRSNTYLFNRKTLLANYLTSFDNRAVNSGNSAANVIRSEIVEYFQAFVLNKSSRKKFSSHFYGSNSLYPISDNGSNIITDPSAFKRKMYLFPTLSYDSEVKSLIE